MKRFRLRKTRRLTCTATMQVDLTQVALQAHWSSLEKSEMRHCPRQFNPKSACASCNHRDDERVGWSGGQVLEYTRRASRSTRVGRKVSCAELRDYMREPPELGHSPDHLGQQAAWKHRANSRRTPAPTKRTRHRNGACERRQRAQKLPGNIDAQSMAAGISQRQSELRGTQ